MGEHRVEHVLGTPAPRRLSMLGKLAVVVIALEIAVGGATALWWYATTSWGRIASQSNMRQLGLSLQMYANACGGRFPETWTDLFQSKDIELTPDVFTSPWSAFDESRRGLSKEQRARLIDAPGSFACTYMYAGNGLKSDGLALDTVLIIEPAEVNRNAGAQILLADNSVQWIPLSEASTERKNYDSLIADFASGVRPLRYRGARDRAATQP